MSVAKNTIILILAGFLFYNTSPLVAQKGSKGFAQIKKLLVQQQQDWNSGNIDAFMNAYWKSEQLQFGGANGITRGWLQTLEGYKKRYPDKATMGQLTFQIKDLTRHSRKVMSLTGSWELDYIHWLQCHHPTGRNRTRTLGGEGRCL